MCSQRLHTPLEYDRTHPERFCLQHCSFSVWQLRGFASCKQGRCAISAVHMGHLPMTLTIPVAIKEAHSEMCEHKHPVQGECYICCHHNCRVMWWCDIQARAPPQALMRITSQSALPTVAAAATTAGQGSTRRRVAPTPVQPGDATCQTLLWPMLCAATQLA